MSLELQMAFNSCFLPLFQVVTNKATSDVAKWLGHGHMGIPLSVVEAATERADGELGPALQDLWSQLYQSVVQQWGQEVRTPALSVAFVCCALPAAQGLNQTASIGGILLNHRATRTRRCLQACGQMSARLWKQYSVTTSSISLTTRLRSICRTCLRRRGARKPPEYASTVSCDVWLC